MTRGAAVAILDGMVDRNERTVVLFGFNAADRADDLRARLATAWRVVPVPEGAERATIAAAFAEADAIFTHHFERGLPPTPRLTLLQVPGAGYDPIDLAALPKGCTVCNVHEHETGIAEYVLLGMLEWVIGMAAMDRRLRRRDWTGSAVKGGNFHGELAGKTLGIVGFGHIGREVARRARSFGMTVGAITRTPRPSELADWVAPMSALEARLPECDFIVIACPLNAETRGLIDRRRLGLMKRSAVLIDVARGDVVAEDALYEALRDRVIAGAVIDTWYVYPAAGEPDPYPSRRPFHELPNVIMTPHASGWTDKVDRRWRVMADNLERLAARKRTVVHGVSETSPSTHLKPRTASGRFYAFFTERDTLDRAAMRRQAEIAPPAAHGTAVLGPHRVAKLRQPKDDRWSNGRPRISPGAFRSPSPSSARHRRSSRTPSRTPPPAAPPG